MSHVPISDRIRLRRLREERRSLFNGVCPTRTIRTWVPEKYMLVDCETGEIWSFALRPSGEITTSRNTNPWGFVQDLIAREYGEQMNAEIMGKLGIPH